MLVLRRLPNEEVRIGDDITIRVISCGGSVRLGITAPKSMRVDRDEIKSANDLKRAITGIDEAEIERVARSVPQL